MMQAGPISSPRMLAKSSCEFFRIDVTCQPCLRALGGVTPDGLSRVGHQLLRDVARSSDIPVRNRVV